MYTAHNVLPHEEKKADYFLYSILYRAADGIITHSGGIKEKLVSRFNIPPNKVTVIPHGNFDSYLPKKTITKEEARKDFNLSIKDDVLLFFGYIREYKGLDLLLNAFKLILEKKPDTVLIIAGFPATKQLYDKYIREVNLLPKKNIKATFNFIPSEDVPKYFISADFVVLPYKKIDHSGIVHMAYSFGKPIIATNVGDFPESVENGKSGFIVNSLSAKDIAAKIIDAFQNKGMIPDMSNYIHQLNQTKYSWNTVAAKTITFYESLFS